mmetsp:Transcript_54639/g.158696  ORF Transcript_54639/g.158696 Transcript_54639/m.158696 type:complete len:270 (-) Transcript_54639:99-908(-)
MAPIPPAEQCCCSCDLPKGVQIISSYTVIVGTFSMLSLVMRGPADRPEESVTAQAVDSLETVYHSLALFAGLKGLMGIMFLDPRRLRLLLTYHIVELLVKTIVLVFREAEACEELRRIQNLHHNSARRMTCENARLFLFLEYTFHTVLFTYFVYIIWSLIVRLEGGEFGPRRTAFDLDQELADRAVLAEPWLFLGPADSQNSALLQRATITGGHVPNSHASGAGGAGFGAGGRQGGAPRPFSGAPRNLNEQGAEASASEPFQGTPHRLE